MAKPTSLNQSVHFKAWMVLLIGMVLGVLGYFFYQEAFAGACARHGGVRQKIPGGGYLCVGTSENKFDPAL